MIRSPRAPLSRATHAALACALLALASCRIGPARTATFILPNGFHGLIRVVYGAPHGEERTVTAQGEVYRIRPPGVLLLKGPAPLEDWRNLEAVYEGGGALPLRSTNDGMGRSRQDAFWVVSGQSEPMPSEPPIAPLVGAGEERYYVGKWPPTH